MSYSQNQYLPGVVVIPSSLQITAITLSNPAVITVALDPVTSANTYIPGQLVKMVVPRSYGMEQIAGKTLKITAVNGNNLSVNIDSNQFDPFIIPAITAEQPASIAPSGSRNLQFSNNTNQIGFQNLNNIGN